MSPILGIWASSSAASRADTGAMFPISSVVVGSSGSSSITFSNIPSTYAHLQIRLFGRTTSGNGSDYIGMTMAGSGSTYTQHQLTGNGSTASAGANNGLGTIPLQRFPGVGTNIMGTMIIDILDYANTNKNKTIRELGGFETNSDGYVALVSGMLVSTAAISSITLTPAAGNFIQYSQAALYGIKGA
jgi:hypothetical protein